MAGSAALSKPATIPASLHGQHERQLEGAALDLYAVQLASLRGDHDARSSTYRLTVYWITVNVLSVTHCESRLLHCN